MRRLNAEVEGVIDVAGPELAGGLTDLGLVDEYRLYVRPFVLGRGKPYFARADRRSALSRPAPSPRTQLG